MAVLTCKACGETFETFPGWVKSGRRKYCGKDCWREAARRALKERGSPTAGKRHTPEARAMMSSAAKGRSVKEKSSQWKGGTFLDKQGYRRVMIDILPAEQQPMARAMASKGSGGKYIAEHRLVAAMMRGTPILPSEVVHHRNGVKSDNRPENLEVMPREGHTKEHRLIENEAALLRIEVSRLRAENETLRAEVAALKLKKTRSPKAGETSLNLFS